MLSLPKASRNTILPFLSTLVLLLSVIAGVVLVQEQKELRSKAATGLVLSWNIESGELRGMYCSGNCPKAVSSSGHPVRSGKYSMRTFLNRNTSSISYRTEVVMKSDPNSAALVRGNRFNFDMSEYWIGLSIYIPSNFVIDQVGKTDTLFQVHQSSGTADGIAPPFALRINGSNWNIASRSSGGTKHTNVSLGNSIGKWTDWVIHVRWSDSSNGFMQIWRDGKLIINRTGPNQYNGETSPYPKMGLYKSVWKPGRPKTNTDSRVIYHDELRIGGASSFYAQVAPPGSPPPSGTPPPPPPTTSTPTPTPTKVPTPTAPLLIS